MRKDGFTYDNHRVLYCDALRETGLVCHGFSTRLEGVSGGRFSSLNLGLFTEDDRQHVLQNFQLFCHDVGVEPAQLVLPKQVHGTQVLQVTEADAGKGIAVSGDLPQVDALVTNRPGVCLATFYADCTPVLLFDPVRRVIATAHSGWRGTLGQIARQAAEVMQRVYGCRGSDILAAMGPSIKQYHFEVGEEVYLAFTERFGALAEENTVQRGMKYYIDTDAINVHSLQEAGLLRSRISCCEDCTYCGEERYFSHRREGKTGRMCAVLALK